MARLGFLHTADVHVATFDALLDDLAPDLQRWHVVEPGLLTAARAGESVTAPVEAALRRLRQDGAGVIVCTCSTLGEIAESLAPALRLPVVRVDRPMAAAAVASGPRVLLVTALTSTLEPSRALLEDEATAQGRPLEIAELALTTAWPLFEDGDGDGFVAALAAGVRRRLAQEPADVVVLAQASMAPAADLLGDLGVPVLASPRAAVAQALALLEGPVVRERRPSDLPAAARMLLAQQAGSHYPYRDPLPMPAEEFLHGHDARGAWVAEHGGRVVGHVAWTEPGSRLADADSLRIAAAAHGCEPEALGWVSSLVVAEEARGSGVGRALLATAVAGIRGAGRRPALEVLPVHPAALGLYTGLGWAEAGRVRPPWLGEPGPDAPDVRVLVLPEPASSPRSSDYRGTVPPRVRLRAIEGVDLGLLPGGDSPFDDFGPRPPRTSPPSPDLRSSPGGLAVVDPDSHALLGMVSWVWQRWGPNPESSNPMIGIWLRREARGRGVGVAAQAALVDLFFEHLRVHRVEAHTDVENLAEQRALERIGFRREGVIRGAQWRQGAYRDGWLYSMMRGEWVAARASDPS